MIDPKHETLPVTRQCTLIGLSRSTLYYTPSNDNADDLALKALIDRLFLEAPSYGTRKMTAALRQMSNTMHADFCVEALEEALARFGRPDYFNTDQGSQFTSMAFTGVLEAAGVRISMDGKGRCMDNIFIERLWRSLKYGDVYLMAYATGTEARRGIGRWIDSYNARRPHQALAYRTPDEVYGGAMARQIPVAVAA